MKKIHIQTEETIKYTEEMVVLQPNRMTNDEFDALLDQAEKQNRRAEGGAKDLAHILGELGLEVTHQTYSFPDSPKESELEIVEVWDGKFGVEDVRAFRLNDYETVAAYTLEEAKLFLLLNTKGLREEDAFDNPHEVPLSSVIFEDESMTKKVTLKEVIKEHWTGEPFIVAFHE